MDAGRPIEPGGPRVSHGDPEGHVLERYHPTKRPDAKGNVVFERLPGYPPDSTGPLADPPGRPR